MSSEHQGLGYNAFKVFIALFVLTALEVGWGMSMRGFGRFVLWGGLIAFAFAKGSLIFMYFMHMKFEKMIVWGLILPTPLLITVILSALMPDVSFSQQLDRPIGDMLDYETGAIQSVVDREGGHADLEPSGSEEHASDGH